MMSAHVPGSGTAPVVGAMAPVVGSNPAIVSPETLLAKLMSSRTLPQFRSLLN
jgi:hypothetical protein